MSNETKRDVFDEAVNELEDVLPDTALFGNEYIADLVGEIRARYDAALPDNLPVIPKDVSEWLTWCKRKHHSLKDALDGETRVSEDTFARAWLDGYEIDNKS
ncbi:MAG: DUF1642 domain-containing protein [Loigolactobacillus coryniformis]|uniref:hypothetical protein n=1 Tax=Loigolactobacillus coryniformis TaxID=1610 RepID=UPI002648F945|nr:hypothetical protein [Loigolactobacillus coryniformis]MDN5950945.1 DUF1642 domain-containing protein [Loigolactobacillus coryniformis]MDN5954236.1 DUF1642 domain-containing protein [Loigolactobacillus coryniformis]